MRSKRTDLLEITWATGPGARASARLGGRRLCKARRQLDGKRTKVEMACRHDEGGSKTPEPIRVTELSTAGTHFPLCVRVR